MKRMETPATKSETMTTKKAIELLKGWQSQIIHGKNTFGEIADHLMEMQSALDGANDICRSMHTIAKREGIQTNWSAFKSQLDKELSIQHAILWPNGGDMGRPALKPLDV